MPSGTTIAFSTTSLVEAALMFMRRKEVRPEWADNQCTFHFTGCTGEDVAFARNAKSTVVARDFNYALVQVKKRMYETKG